MPSHTYTARAGVSLGPSTTEFPPVRGDRQPAWPPQNHRPFIVAGGVALAVAIPLLLIADDATGRGQTLLHDAGLVALLLSGVAFIAAAAIRSHDRAIEAATAQGVGEIHRLDTLHPVIQGVDIHLSEIVGRLEAAVGQRVDQLGRRVDVVEQERDRLVGAVLDQLGRIEVALPERLAERLEELERAAQQRDEHGEVLHGIAGWAMQVDRRLADFQVMPHQPNGRSDSPMEMSDGEMRAYFLGFLDRQAEPGASDGT